MGAREEPFLEALLASLAGVATTLIVNDNSGLAASPNAAVIARSGFARDGRIVLDTTPFSDFATNRNVLLARHAEHDAGEWIAFVDADEVHDVAAARIAHNLGSLPDDVAIVDGYTRHFFQSFDWYLSIERRLSFFRFTPELRWAGRVHEKLEGVRGSSLVLPYVYAHYGHVYSTRHHAEKGRQYAALGAEGGIVRREHVGAIDPAPYFKKYWPRVFRYHGAHNRFAQPLVARYRGEWADDLARIETIVPAYQPPPVRAANVFRRLNYEYRWRGRALDPRARMLLAP